MKISEGFIGFFTVLLTKELTLADTIHIFKLNNFTTIYNLQLLKNILYDCIELF